MPVREIEIDLSSLLPPYVQASILCKESSGLSFSSDSVSLLQGLGEENMAAVAIHNPLPVQRSTYISVKLPSDICAQVPKQETFANNH